MCLCTLWLQLMVYHRSFLPQVNSTPRCSITKGFLYTPRFLPVPVGVGPLKGAGFVGRGMVLRFGTLR